MSVKSIIPCIFLKNAKLVKGFKEQELISEDACAYVSSLAGSGADELLIFDLSESDEEHERNIRLIREINRSIDRKSVV